MSFLRIQSLSLDHGDGSELAEHGLGGKQQATLRSKSSIATLIQFVRNPVANVGEVLEYWRDGYTTQERSQKQQQDNRKQTLYLKLRNVSSTLYVPALRR